MAEEIVLKATSKDLMVPDWEANLMICDIINSSDEKSVSLVTENIKHRLNNKNRKICFLALILIECAMKNCGPTLYNQVCQKEFLDYMSALARGKKGEENQEKALELVQCWAFSFKTNRDKYPLFGKLYGALQELKLNFPPEDKVHLITIYNDTPNELINNSSLYTNDSPFSKLDNDLHILEDHMILFEDLYLGGEYNENISLINDEIEFLEQCRSRMTELIEGGSYGVFPDGIYEIILNCNDRLVQLLSISKNPNTAIEEITKLRAQIEKKNKNKTTPKPDTSSDSSSDSTTTEDEEVFFNDNIKKKGDKKDNQKSFQFPTPPTLVSKNYKAEKSSSDSDTSTTTSSSDSDEDNKKSNKNKENPSKLLDDILNE